MKRIPENNHVCSRNRETVRGIRTELLICLILALATLSVYWQVRNYEFVMFDDDVYLTENPHVRAGLTPKSIGWAFTATYASNWHPLTWLSHMLDVQLYGMNPGQHHLTNVLFHLINTLLLFLVLSQMTEKVWQSAFVAALFALHPLHAESVAWVSERKDLLSTFFWILTMGAYTRYVKKPEIKTYLPVFFCFVLGLMSKPMVITLPFVLLLLDYWPLERMTHRESGFWNLIREKLPLIALSAGSGAITFFAQQSGGAVKSLEAFSLDIRIANALISYVRYIEKMVCPYNLAFLYPHPAALSLWQAAGAFVLLVLISALVFWQIRQRAYLAVGWLWYIGTLVPVIGLVQVGLQSMADRYTYIPFIGIFIMLAWGIPELLTGKIYKKYICAVSAVMILTLMGILAWHQTAYWQSSITLFRRALDVTSGNYIAHNALANALQAKGRWDEAVFHYREAVRLEPNFAKAYNNLATALEEQGKIDEAIAAYRETLRISPGLAKAHYNLAYALEKQGKPDEAVRHYTESLRLNPDDTDVRISLGIILLRQQKTDEAIFHLEKALEARPDHIEILNNLGVALAYKGRYRESVAYFQKALKIKPDDTNAYANLQKVLSWIQQESGKN
jgi:tetratricopeptide (TPR) repeat protein